MRKPATSLCVLSLLLPVALVAQEQKHLTVADVFQFGKKMRGDYLRPIGWLDNNHYLAFGPQKKGDKPGFVKVRAGTGETTPHVDHAALAKALAAIAGIDAAHAEKLCRNRGLFHWNHNHSAALLNTANDLIWYDLASNRARRLTNTPQPEVGEDFSPDGSMVAYIQGHDLYVVGVGRRRPRALTNGGTKELLYGRLDWVYQEELYGRGNFKGFWWAPDSTHIALLRLDESPVKEFTLVSDTPVRPKVEVENYPKAGDPNPKASLGVVPVRGGDITWFDLSDYGTAEILISRVAWHPDGSEVYLQVQDRAQTWLDLLAGTAKDGKVRKLFREGSDCWVEADVNPHWLEDGKSFLWLSERDGFKHLYRFGRDGKLQLRLTRGEFEIDKLVGVDEADGKIYVLSDKDDTRSQRLWSMKLEGNEMQLLTKEPGWHNIKMSKDLKLCLDAYSSVAVVGRMDVLTAGGELQRKVGGAKQEVLKGYDWVLPEAVQVKNRKGFVMEATMLKPLGYKKGKRYPVLCHIYAGPHAPRNTNRWGGAFYLWHQLLAQKGYLVWICDNESASGKGRKATAACYKNMGTRETEDLEDSVKWLVEQGYADPKRVGIWGWSYGGYQTSFCMTHSKVWSTGIAVNPVTDWRLYDSIYTERYMGLPSENREGYERSSVNRAAKNLHGKLLLVHATMDDNVHMQNSLQFIYALQQAGKQFDFMVYPRRRHGIANEKQRIHLFTKMTEFLQRNL